MYYIILLTGIFFMLINKRPLFLVFAGILCLLAGFRYGIGVDYLAYEYLYNRLQFSFLDEIKVGLDHQEVGFRAIGAFLKGLGVTYQQYSTIFAIVNIFFISKICIKYSKNPTLSLLLFFCFYYFTWTFNAIRQAIVIAVGLYYLLKSLEDKKVLKLIIIVALLSLIHSSAFIILILYFVSKIEFNKKKLILFSVFSVLFSLFPMALIISKLTFLPLYSRILPYLDPTVSINFFDFQSLTRIVFLIIAIIYYDQYCKQSEIARKIINMYIISIILYFLLQFSELTAARVAIYGKFLDIIILANILFLYKKIINKLLYISGIILLCIVYLFKELGQVNNAISSDSLLTPYVNVFNKDDYIFTNIFIEQESD